MPTIEEILKLSKEKQLEIMEAIQEKMDDMVWENEELSPAHLEFIKKRVEQINAAPHQTFLWSEVKEKLANRWNTQ